MQESKLHRTGKSAARFDLPKSVRDLCTDGKRLFAMDYGWTAGRPLREIDPQTGKVTREIVTEANLVNRAFGAAGMVWLDGKLWVLEGMHGRLNAVDPANGEVTRVIQTKERWLTSLAHDGQHFVAGSRKELLWIDPKDGSVARRVAVNYPIRCLTYHDGSLYLMEQPVFGHDKNHQRIRVWPKKTVIYKLTLR